MNSPPLYLATGFFILLSFSILLGRGTFAQHPEALILVYIFLFFAILFLIIFYSLQTKKQSGLLSWIARGAHSYIVRLGIEQWWGIQKIKQHSRHVALALDQFNATMDIAKLRPVQHHFWLALLWQVMVQVVNMCTVYFVAYALGSPLTVLATVVVYALTKLVAMASFTPSAIGFFEVTMTLLLTAFGVTTGAAIAMTLITRAFTFWLPIPAGWLVYHRFMAYLDTT